MRQRFTLSNDEIEVACDLLWFVEREAAVPDVTRLRSLLD
jgi:hypothetical protein